MKINKKHQLKTYINANSDTRPLLNYIHKYNDEMVEVTDGFVLARIPAEEIEAEYYLPKQQYPDVVDKSKSVFVPVTENVPELYGQFPNTNAVIPDKNDAVLTIGINSKKLYNLSRLLGKDELELNIISEARQIYVNTANEEDNNAYGIFMPLKIFDNMHTTKEIIENKKIVEWLTKQEFYQRLMDRYRKETKVETNN